MNGEAYSQFDYYSLKVSNYRENNDIIYLSFLLLPRTHVRWRESPHQSPKNKKIRQVQLNSKMERSSIVNPLLSLSQSDLIKQIYFSEKFYCSFRGTFTLRQNRAQSLVFQ
jgi:hypothetical protein